MLIDESFLTDDERKAAEAAFRGLPLNSQWSKGAQRIYLGIVAVTRGRAVVTDQDREEAVGTI